MLSLHVRYCTLLFLVLIFIPVAAHGQPVTRENSKTAAQTSEQTHEPSKPHDPLGRDTPHGTVFGFLQAAQSGKYDEASQYLRLSKRERLSQGDALAHQLKVLMDSAFVGRVGAISENQEGSAQAGVPHDHERIGVFRIDDNETNVDLVRVAEAGDGEVWLFSSETLAAVPELYGQIETSEMESHLPGFLTNERVFSTPLWRWIAFLVLIPIALALSWAITGLMSKGTRVWRRWRRYAVIQDLHASIDGPARLILTTIFHATGVAFLGLPLLFREYYRRFAGVLLAAGAAWLVFRLIDRWGERARLKALKGSGYKSGSVVLLGQKILKAAVVVAAALVILSIFGFDMTTAVAGLGIGSIALAFAAQKTLENLFGGMSILGDQVIRVGETCVIGDKEGTVEDISLRSTRLRTLNRTELSVPNGQLANMNVENLSRRDSFLFQATIRLRHETSPEQLRSVLKEIQDLLRNHPKVDPSVARVRFVGIGEVGLEIEIHCQVRTSVLDEFLVVREDLLLRMMDLVAAAGTGFAYRRTPPLEGGLQKPAIAEDAPQQRRRA
jgi:MscS family membrane protein